METQTIVFLAAVIFLLFIVSIIYKKGKDSNGRPLGAIAGTTGATSTVVPTTHRSSSIKLYWENTKSRPTRWKLFVTLLGLIFLEVILYTSAPWAAGMFQGNALWHLIIYPAGALILMLARDLPGDKLIPVALPFIGLAIVGLSHFNGGSLPSVWNSFWRGSGTPPSFVTVCTGAKKEWRFGITPEKINPEASCAPDLWHDGHCINVQRARWTNDTTIYRHCGGKLPKDVEWAWTADQTFVGAVALVQPRYNY